MLSAVEFVVVLVVMLAVMLVSALLHKFKYEIARGE